MAFNEFKQLITDHGFLRTIGLEIAKGIAEGGNSSSFSSFNPTGQQTGRAGGRGLSGDTSPKEVRKAQLDEIKARQKHSKYTNQLVKTFEKLNKELLKGDKDMNAARRKTVAYTQTFESEWGKAMEKVFSSKRAEDKLVKRLNAKLEENVGSMDDVLKIQRRHQILGERIARSEGIISQHTIDAHKKYSVALSESMEGIDTFGESFVRTAKSTIRAFFSYESAIVQLTRATKILYQDYKLQIKTGSRFENVFKQQWDAIFAGVDPSAMTELMAQSRQAGLTFGSLDEYMEVTKQQQEKYYNQIGDLTESMRFGTTMFHILGKSGIKPSAVAMDSLGNTFRVMNKIVGTTSEQFNQMLEQVTADEDVQNRLRTAKASERQGIIAGIVQQIKLNVAMGLTAEQAQGAALAMGKIAGGGAKERFKRAAQIQMAFGALGVEGGARAAELVRKGKARMSPDEITELEKLGTKFTAVATAAQAGSFQGEFVRDTLLEKGNLEEFFGATSPLNKQLAEGLEANKDVLEDILQAIKDGPSGFEKMMMTFDKTTSGLTTGLGGLAAGTIALSGALYTTGAVASRLGIGAGMGSAGLGAGMKAGGKFVGKAAGGIGATVMVGKDLYDLSQGDTSKANTGALIGSVIGGAVGLLGGPMGVAIGVGVGNMVGEAIGGHFDSKEATEGGSVTSNTAELLDPTNRTAVASEHANELLAQNNEYQKLSIEQQAGMITDQRAKDRLAALQNSGQFQYTVDS